MEVPVTKVGMANPDRTVSHKRLQYVVENRYKKPLSSDLIQNVIATETLND
jgi:hypothetical protein